MTTSLWLRNIAAFGVQTTLVIAVAAVAFRMLRLRNAGVALVFWRAVLIACLVMPIAQPWSVPSTAADSVVGASLAVDGTSPNTGAVFPPAPAWNAAAIALTCIAAGVVLRVLWLLVGALSLRRLRRTATPLEPVPAGIDEAQARVGVRATLCVSTRVGGPITFGLTNPVIIFPPSILSLAPHVQAAIAYHELLHVDRRDWLEEVFEEVVRSVFWFHPAIRWVIGRIQLSREQVVDEGVIGLLESRDRYVEALLAVASTQSPGSLVPAPLFLRRRMLKQRLAGILQEKITMTTRRVIASFIISAAALVLIGVVAVRAFPLEARGQQTGGPPVQIARGAEHLLHGELPEYPRHAIEARIEGDVVVDLSIDERGEVSDARVLSGPEELRRATLQAVLGWHYSAASVRATSAQATIHFRLPTDSEKGNVEYGGRGFAFAETGEKGEKNEEWTPARAEHLMMEIESALASGTLSAAERREMETKYQIARTMLAKARARAGTRPVFEGTPRLVQIRSERVPQSVLREITAGIGVKIGDPITEDTVKHIREVVSAIDEHLRVTLQSDERGGVVLAIIAP